MPTNTVIIGLVFILLPFSTVAVPYTQMQTISDPLILYYMEFMKNDTTVVIGADTGKGFLLEQVGDNNTFELNQNVNNGSVSHITGIKYSLDKEWRIICGWSEDVLV